MTKSTNYLKNAFWILLILNFASPIFKSIYKQYNDHVDPKNKIGVVHISSLITSSTKINKQLAKFFKDTEIKAILIKMECPGGAAGSSQAISQEILELKQKYPKPIITYCENMCASGAYYIAATTDHIVATSSSLVGSIGAKIGTQFKLKEFLQGYKIQSHAVASGEYKNATDPFSDYTDAQKAMLQDVVNDCYKQFTADIAKYRHLPIAEKDIWANGKIFTGNEALALKLIDEIGNQTTALNHIKKLILHSNREIELVKTQEPSRFSKLISGGEDNEDEAETSLANSISNEVFTFLQKQGVSF